MNIKYRKRREIYRGRYSKKVIAKRKETKKERIMK